MKSVALCKTPKPWLHMTRRDRADVLAEQFLGSRRFQIPDLRFKTGDLLNGRSPGIAIIIMAYLGYVRKRAMMYYVMR